jgi:diacylglycerol kinase family enzyme
MYVHPIRPELDVKLVPVELRETEPRVAVLLNANAKRVDEKVRRALTHVVPEGDLFLTRTFEEARAVAETVVERRYQTVFTGGGDGTFVGFFNEILNVLDRKKASGAGYRLPRFGVLKLGTGNALAGITGASPMRGDGVVDDVLRARAGQVHGVLKIELLSAEGKRTPFAGIGLDAGILNHYIELKRALGHGPLGGLIKGGAGYALAIAGRSIPYYSVSRRPEIEVRSRGIAYRVGADGKPTGNPMGPGALLYRGPAIIASCSTVPCYGYNFRLFPFAGSRRGMMQLRVANVGAAKIVGNLYPTIWHGKWQDENVHDFLVEDIEIKVDRKVPFQIGGDAEGYRDQVRLSVSKQTVELLDFNSAQRV